jgi:predicted RNase H-like HicB family nuclease
MSHSWKNCPARTRKGKRFDEARANLQEAISMVLEANRELSEQSLRGADVIREALTLPVE